MSLAFHRTTRFLVATFLLAMFFNQDLLAQGPRLLKVGVTPDDQRVAPLKDLNGYFPFRKSETRQDWRRRQVQVRQRLLVSQGIWPLPTKTPLKSVIHGRKVFNDYSIEKVYFQSFPGFYVTGSLYRPRNKTGPHPAVLCPHGHWSNGRFHEVAASGVQAQIKLGAEQFTQAGRSPLQARCVHLARMGCIVFHYDMIGYADSVQISFDLAHKFAQQRPEMNHLQRWGLFSPQAESQLQSVMGLQTINSIRAIDFLETLTDVDKKRIAVTGASGGGTQTFMLAAIDPRIAAAFPAVMVSTAMQGGCTCENACCLRVGTGNVEIAALFAPRPLGLSAADDWTREMTTKGFPELQAHYRMLGAADHVKLLSRTEFKHNYNQVSRQAMYHLFNQHLKLGFEKVPPEKDYSFQGINDLTVWNKANPKPAGGADFERNLLQYWHRDTQRQLDQLIPRDKASFRKYRQVVGSGIDTVVGRGLPRPADVEYDQLHKEEKDQHIELAGWLNTAQNGGKLPTVFLYPKQWNGHIAIWLSEKGKAGIYQANGQPNTHVQKLLDQELCVVGIDLLYQGEFLVDGKAITKTRRVANPRESAAYSFGYNSTLFARRVHDILALVTFIRNHDYTPKSVSVIALDQTGPLAIAARAQARDAIDQLAANTQQFRFSNVSDLHSPTFLPGGARYHDLVGMLAVASPEATWIASESSQSIHVAQSAYQALEAKDKMVLSQEPANQRSQAAVRWIIQQTTSP